MQPFTNEDLVYYQEERREFFAFLPVLTIQGWAWLTDIKEVATCDFTSDPTGRWHTHLERLN